MIRRIGIIAAAAVAFGSTGPAQPVEAPGPTPAEQLRSAGIVHPGATPRPPAEALIESLANWLSAEFGLAQMKAAPRVVLATPGRMWKIRMEAANTQPERRQVDMPDNIVAVYDTRSRVIYLPHTWNGETVAQTSILVHELVHHLQREAGQRFACAEEGERLPFAAQRRWLAMFGKSLEEEFGIDALTLLVRTNCMF